jgi:hypothetical protein
MSAAFRNLNAHAFWRKTDYQLTVTNVLGANGSIAVHWITKGTKHRLDILRGLDGIIESGEMLLVPPSCLDVVHQLRKVEAATKSNKGVSVENLLFYVSKSAVLCCEFEVRTVLVVLVSVLGLDPLPYNTVVNTFQPSVH